MPTTRIQYENLPVEVRAAVERTTGPVAASDSSAEGLNSSVAAKLHTSAGAFFVKALPTDHRWAWTQTREADIAAHVQPVAPALVGRVMTDGWDVLIFDALHGHHADYRPGSDDLPATVDLLRRIADLACPDVELRQAEQRLAEYVDHPNDVRFFAGGALLHTDWNNSNVIVDGARAHIVDWGWATVGAAWLDAGYWIIWLIASGHHPDSAERWAARVPAWSSAPADGVAAFAAANSRLWAEIGGLDPDPWTTRMASASRRWHDFRRAASLREDRDVAREDVTREKVE